MSFRHLFFNKIVYFTGNRNHESFSCNNGFPTFITTTRATYGHWWWRIYKWIDGMHAVPVVEEPEPESALDKRCCNNCFNNNHCTEGENIIQGCRRNNYAGWDVRYLCGDCNDLSCNNCEDLMGMGGCANLHDIDCASRSDLLKKNWVIKKELQGDDRVKKIKDMFK